MFDAYKAADGWGLSSGGIDRIIANCYCQHKSFYLIDNRQEKFKILEPIYKINTFCTGEGGDFGLPTVFKGIREAQTLDADII